MADGFATLPQPPYYAVIFSSLRRGGPDDGYAGTAARMLELVQQQPGFLGAESARTVRSAAAQHRLRLPALLPAAAIAQWRMQDEHVTARRRGRNEWYEHFEVRVARVERAYGKASGAASA